MTSGPPSDDAWSRWRVRIEEGAREPLCIGLANTHPLREGATDRIACIEDVLAFARGQGVMDDAAHARAAAYALAHPRAAQAELAAVHALRAAVLRLLMNAASGEDDRALLAREFESAQRALAAELRDGALRVRPRRPRLGLESLRLMAAVSASALLASPDVARVRRCADERGCGRLFIDASRNGTRRYCLSGDCGNRARQAAFRARRRDAHAR